MTTFKGMTFPNRMMAILPEHYMILKITPLGDKKTKNQKTRVDRENRMGADH